jgi:hypothetical protein
MVGRAKAHLRLAHPPVPSSCGARRPWRRGSKDGSTSRPVLRAARERAPVAITAEPHAGMTLAQPSLRGGRRRSNPGLALRLLDCFASLAMTVVRPGFSPCRSTGFGRDDAAAGGIWFGTSA